MQNTEETIKTVVAALEDIKASNIAVVDTSKLSSMFERIVIASANSPRQTRALANHVVQQIKLQGTPVLSTEGEDSGEWVLVDLGTVVVHIMQPAVRAYYRLEELWDKQYTPRAPTHHDPT